MVVAAIEAGNSKFFREAGVNGYEYLDKIVQMPFAVPLMTDSEKRNLIEGYLNPNIKAGRIIVVLLRIIYCITNFILCNCCIVYGILIMCGVMICVL